MSYLQDYLANKNQPKKNSQLLEFYKEFTEIIESEELDWEEKFDLGFSLRKEKYPDIYIDYCDPDTTYEEDIMAFYRAVKEKVEEE